MESSWQLHVLVKHFFFSFYENNNHNLVSLHNMSFWSKFIVFVILMWMEKRFVLLCFAAVLHPASHEAHHVLQTFSWCRNWWWYNKVLCAHLGNETLHLQTATNKEEITTAATNPSTTATTTYGWEGGPVQAYFVGFIYLCSYLLWTSVLHVLFRLYPLGIYCAIH